MAGYVIRRGADAEYLPPGALIPGAVGITRWRAVGEADGAAHTEFGVTRIEAGGSSATHVHSFEESFHILQGEVVLATPESTVHLVAATTASCRSASRIAGRRSRARERSGRTC